LVISSEAASMTPPIETQLRSASADSLVLEIRFEGRLQVFHLRGLPVTTKPKVRIYADNAPVGRTPATQTAELRALNVMLPR